MIETLTYSIDSEEWMTAAYGHQLRNLPQQMQDYAHKIYSKVHYRWVHGSIVHPLPLSETKFWTAMRDSLYDAAAALIHIERGIGSWCVACRDNLSGHSTLIDRGAILLGLK